MTVVILPPPDEEAYPTLGPYVCDFIEEYLCHGPGDIKGQPVTLDDEQRAWIYRLYEVYPAHITERKGRGIRSKSPHPQAGRRRFHEGVLSLPKGSAKTEFAAWIAACELHPDGPVRCDGFDARRGVPDQPRPRGITNPYIPMLAYTEEQTEELAYGALLSILSESRIAGDFDLGLERIIAIHGEGKVEAVAGSPNARDGARTTFMHGDEIHRFTLEKLRTAWTVMLQNLTKRFMSDPWALATTTAPALGSDSTGERTMRSAQRILEGPQPERSRLFYFHRQASDGYDLDSREQRRAAVLEARGPYKSRWSDIDRIVDDYEQDGADRQYWIRVQLNRAVTGAGKAFDITKWRSLAKPEYREEPGGMITLGFDGSRFDDATALIATGVRSGHQWPLGIWERPPEAEDWEVPRDEVRGAVEDAFATYQVMRFYPDPPKWEGDIDEWRGRYGEKVVVEWWTTRRRQMAEALRAWKTAMEQGDLSHSGDEVLTRHVGNAYKVETGLFDDDDRPLWLIRKERPDSPDKIDGAMGACLSWEARRDVIAAGALEETESVYETRGLVRW